MALREEQGGGTAAKQPGSTIKIGSAPKKKSSPPPKSKIAQPTRGYRQPALQRRISTNNRNGGSPSGVASGSSKSIVPPAPPQPVAPDNNSYLKSDSVYQRQLAAYAKSLADFQADQGLARDDYNTGYANTARDIGLAKGDAQKNLQNDFASRGMLQSSLYNQGLGELNTQYQNQSNDLAKQRTSFLDQLAQEFTKYKGESGSQQSNAMQEALRRRTEKYNI